MSSQLIQFGMIPVGNGFSMLTEFKDNLLDNIEDESLLTLIKKQLDRVNREESEEIAKIRERTTNKKKEIVSRMKEVKSLMMKTLEEATKSKDKILRLSIKGVLGSGYAGTDNLPSTEGWIRNNGEIYSVVEKLIDELLRKGYNPTIEVPYRTVKENYLKESLDSEGEVPFYWIKSIDSLVSGGHIMVITCDMN